MHLFVYTNLKKHTLMQRGVRFDMCPFGTGAFDMGSEKRSKQFKINGLSCFMEAFSEGPIWTIQMAKAFPCNVALVFYFVCFFLGPSVVSVWTSKAFINPMVCL